MPTSARPTRRGDGRDPPGALRPFARHGGPHWDPALRLAARSCASGWPRPPACARCWGWSSTTCPPGTTSPPPRPRSTVRRRPRSWSRSRRTRRTRRAPSDGPGSHARRSRPQSPSAPPGPAWWWCRSPSRSRRATGLGRPGPRRRARGVWRLADRAPVRPAQSRRSASASPALAGIHEAAVRAVYPEASAAEILRAGAGAAAEGPSSCSPGCPGPASPPSRGPSSRTSPTAACGA